MTLGIASLIGLALMALCYQLAEARQRKLDNVETRRQDAIKQKLVADGYGWMYEG